MESNKGVFRGSDGKKTKSGVQMTCMVAFHHSRFSNLISPANSSMNQSLPVLDPVITPINAYSPSWSFIIDNAIYVYNW